MSNLDSEISRLRKLAGLSSSSSKASQRPLIEKVEQDEAPRSRRSIRSRRSKPLISESHRRQKIREARRREEIEEIEENEEIYENNDSGDYGYDIVAEDQYLAEKIEKQKVSENKLREWAGLPLLEGKDDEDCDDDEDDDDDMSSALGVNNDKPRKAKSISKRRKRKVKESGFDPADDSRYDWHPQSPRYDMEGRETQFEELAESRSIEVKKEVVSFFDEISELAQTAKKNMLEAIEEVEQTESGIFDGEAFFEFLQADLDLMKEHTDMFTDPQYVIKESGGFVHVENPIEFMKEYEKQINDSQY